MRNKNIFDNYITNVKTVIEICSFVSNLSDLSWCLFIIVKIVWHYIYKYIYIYCIYWENQILWQKVHLECLMRGLVNLNCGAVFSLFKPLGFRSIRNFGGIHNRFGFCLLYTQNSIRNFAFYLMKMNNESCFNDNNTFAFL